MTTRTQAMLVLMLLVFMALTGWLLAYPLCEWAARGYTWRLVAGTRECQVALSLGVSNVVWVKPEAVFR